MPAAAPCDPVQPLPQRKLPYVLGVIYGVLQWADMNAATPPRSRGRSTHTAAQARGSTATSPTPPSRRICSRRSRRCTRRGPFNSNPMGVNSISFGARHERHTGVHRTCGEPDETKKLPHLKNATALLCEQVHAVRARGLCVGLRHRRHHQMRRAPQSRAVRKQRRDAGQIQK